MSWSIPFWYESEEQLKEQSIGNWINNLFKPSLETVTTSATTLLIVIGFVLIVAYMLFVKLKIIR